MSVDTNLLHRKFSEEPASAFVEGVEVQEVRAWLHEIDVLRAELEIAKAEVTTARALMAEEAARWHLQSQADLLAKSEEERRCPICERPPHPNESSRGGWCSNPFHEAGTYRARAAEHGAAAGFIRTLAPLPAYLVAVPVDLIEKWALIISKAEGPHARGCSRPYMEFDRPCSCGLDGLRAALSALLKEKR